MPTFVRHQEIAHRIGPGGSLAIRVTEADVRLRATDGDEAHVNAVFEIRAGSEEEADSIFEASALQIATAGNTLEVQDRSGRNDLGAALRRLVSGRSPVGLSLEGTAPAAASVRIESVSGDLVVEGMRGEQRYTTTSGDIFATELGGSLALRSVSGDVTVRGVDPLSLTAESVSGDLSAVVPLLRQGHISSVSGDLELEARLDPAGAFRAETVSGDFVLGLAGSATLEVHGISSDLHAEVDHRLEGTSDRRRVVVGDGTPRFVFSSMSGDVSVRRPRRIDAAAAPTSPPPASEPPPRAAEPVDEAESLEILRALERGEIDVEEASTRLAGGRSDA